MTAFVHVSVIPMDREQVLPDQTVLVRGDRIIAMGPATQVPVPAGATQVDSRGKFLIPGLGDMHVHLRAFHRDSTRLPSFLLMLVATGVTTVRDMHSGGGPVDDEALGTWTLATRERVARGELVGPRIYTSGDPDYISPAAAAASVAKLHAAGHDFVKVYNDAKDPAVFDSIKATAGRVGIRLGGHVPVGGLPWAFAALGSIEHLMSYARDVVGYEQDAIQARWWRASAPWNQPDYRLDAAKLRELALATKRADVWNCPTLSAVVRSPAEASPLFQIGDSFLNLALQVVAGLHAAGAGLLSGTDKGSDRDLLEGRDLVRDLELLVEAGLTPYEALRTSTWNVAAFLKTTDSTGTVAVGKRADLVLLEANPLTDIGQARARTGVMVGGHWLPRSEIDRQLQAMAANVTTDDGCQSQSRNQCRQGRTRRDRARPPSP